MKRVIGPYVFEGGGAKSLNYQSLAKDLARATLEIPFNIPPYFALVARALGILEGTDYRLHSCVPCACVMKTAFFLFFSFDAAASVFVLLDCFRESWNGHLRVFVNVWYQRYVVQYDMCASFNDSELFVSLSCILSCALLFLMDSGSRMYI